MYDIAETEISYDYMLKLNEKAVSLKFAVLGGWAVYLQVKKTYNAAFGKDYLKSRDIDVFVDAKDEEKFFQVIKSFGFKESAYNFRYELIYDRVDKSIISTEQAKKKQIFNLIYIFLDIFSNKKTKKLGSWVLAELNVTKIETVEGFPVLTVETLLALKAVSFFEREKLDKELKDACDIYALLMYSGKKSKINLMLKKAIEKIISRQDLQEYIAENVLGDSLKSSLVNLSLKGLLET